MHALEVTRVGNYSIRPLKYKNKKSAFALYGPEEAVPMFSKNSDIKRTHLFESSRPATIPRLFHVRDRVFYATRNKNVGDPSADCSLHIDMLGSMLIISISRDHLDRSTASCRWTGLSKEGNVNAAMLSGSTRRSLKASEHCQGQLVRVPSCMLS